MKHVGTVRGERRPDGFSVLTPILAVFFFARVVAILFSETKSTATPFDEAFCLFLSPFFVFAVFRGYPRSILVPFVLYALMDIVGIWVADVPGLTQPAAGLVDILLDFKFPLMTIGLYQIIRRRGSYRHFLFVIAWVFIVIAVINSPFVVRDLLDGRNDLFGRYLERRVGFAQPVGILGNKLDSVWTTAIAAMSSMFLYLSSQRRNIFYLLLFLYLSAFMLIHLSVKESVAFVAVVALVPLRGKGLEGWLQRAPFIFFAIFAGLAVTPLGGAIFGQADTYALSSSSDQVRSRLTIHSFEIASDNFPAGSGAGTFASVPSYTFGYSYLYDRYGISSLFGGSRKDPWYLVDVFWPKIVAQSGFFGALIFLWFIFAISWPPLLLFISSRGAVGWFCLATQVFLLIVSVGASPYSQENLYPVSAVAAATAAVALERRALLARRRRLAMRSARRSLSV